MTNKKERFKGPFKVTTSFHLLKEKYEELAKSDDEIAKVQAENALALFEKHPQLERGFETTKELFDNKDAVNSLMSQLFPPALATNEIKAAMFPFSNESFFQSTRLKNIVNDRDGDVVLDFFDMSAEFTEDGMFNNLPYAVIINKYYQYPVDFSRPLHVFYEDANGKERKYRVTYNADFLDIQPTDKAIEITDEIMGELLLNSSKKEVWTKYFPKDSWDLKGFGIINMVDVTIDGNIDSFKEHLIGSTEENNFDVISEHFRRIFNIENLRIGAFQVTGKYLERGWDPNVQSFVLGDLQQKLAKDFACEYVYQQLFEEHKMVVLPNVNVYDTDNKDNFLRQSILDKGVQSLILVPIAVNGEVVSMAEIGASEPYKLNHINATKLDDVMPFIQSYIERALDDLQNLISAIIQQECTSIHPSVQWKFEEEAMNFYKKKQRTENVSFEEVVFENVYPLYGQIDISGSSRARNKATQSDLKLLLQESIDSLEGVTKNHELPYFDQVIYQAKEHLKIVKKEFQANTEQVVTDFFEHELLPVLKYLCESEYQTPKLDDFFQRLDAENKSLYVDRKSYDDTVNGINKELAMFIDERQEQAQEIYPHFFQKYKTDGVEHDLYVGQSIAPEKLYHKSMLYNLRLWQLQVACEMDAKFYEIQEKYPIDLKCASLIFAYDSPMSIRYRIDEKHFDVDGAYNVRYEMIKKRIDKAHIKSTGERLTQPGKLAVVYSNNHIEQEYLGYFKFLQSKGLVGDHIEVVELEDLQGASGMKAIRAELSYDNQEKSEKLYTIEDLKEA